MRAVPLLLSVLALATAPAGGADVGYHLLPTRTGQLRIWYPAAPSLVPVMPRGAYLDPRWPEGADEIMARAEARRNATPELTRPALDRLSPARPFAPVAEGRHPAVLFATDPIPGREELAEALASRGLVVVAPVAPWRRPRPAADPVTVELRLQGAEVLLDTVAQLEFADPGVGVVGSSPELALSERRSDVAAIVLLDLPGLRPGEAESAGCPVLDLTDRSSGSADRPGVDATAETIAAFVRSQLGSAAAESTGQPAGPRAGGKE